VRRCVLDHSRAGSLFVQNREDLSQGARLILGVDLREVGCRIEVGFPRPTAVTAEARAEKGGEHHQAVQRMGRLHRASHDWNPHRDAILFGWLDDDVRRQRPRHVRRLIAECQCRLGLPGDVSMIH